MLTTTGLTNPLKWKGGCAIVLVGCVATAIVIIHAIASVEETRRLEDETAEAQRTGVGSGMTTLFRFACLSRVAWGTGYPVTCAGLPVVGFLDGPT
jgi:hypothetical protein